MKLSQILLSASVIAGLSVGSNVVASADQNNVNISNQPVAIASDQIPSYEINLQEADSTPTDRPTIVIQAKDADAVKQISSNVSNINKENKNLNISNDSTSYVEADAKKTSKSRYSARGALKAAGKGAVKGAVTGAITGSFADGIGAVPGSIIGANMGVYKVLMGYYALGGDKKWWQK